MTRVETLKGAVICDFERREEALLCLPAMSRALRETLRLQGGSPRPMPLPRGCEHVAMMGREHVVVCKP